MSVIGNFISAVPRRPGFDLYCMDPQPTVATPKIVVYKKAAGSDKIEQTLSFDASSGLRESRIAANTREFGSTTKAASIFYQITNGTLYEYRLNTAGTQYLYNVSNVPATSDTYPNSPILGTSLATTLCGETNQIAYLFYQGTDKRIWYVWQDSFGSWSLPSQVTREPVSDLTTLSAFSWAESDPNATAIIDVVCVAYNQSPGRFKVHMRRKLRGNAVATLQTYFEPVIDYTNAPTRGPFSALYIGSPSIKDGCSSPNQGDYLFFTQLLQDPSRIWERTVPASNPGIASDYNVVVSTTAVLQVPARGTSLTTIYDTKEDSSSSGGSTKTTVTVVYVSPEGVVDYKEIYPK